MLSLEKENSWLINFLKESGYRRIKSDDSDSILYFKSFSDETRVGGGVMVYSNIKENRVKVMAKYPANLNFELGYTTAEDVENYLQLVRTISWDINAEVYRVVNSCNRRLVE